MELVCPGLKGQVCIEDSEEWCGNGWSRDVITVSKVCF